jgi:hypothetical protein
MRTYHDIVKSAEAEVKAIDFLSKNMAKDVIGALKKVIGGGDYHPAYTHQDPVPFRERMAYYRRMTNAR